MVAETAEVCWLEYHMQETSLEICMGLPKPLIEY